jgi:hypothetical protein
MPRKPRKIKITKSPLTDGERHLLLTGECCLAKNKPWADGSSWLRPFMLSSPGGRDELRTLWLRRRAELLQEWRQQKRKGLPWAAKEFDTNERA